MSESGIWGCVEMSAFGKEMAMGMTVTGEAPRDEGCQSKREVVIIEAMYIQKSSNHLNTIDI